MCPQKNGELVVDMGDEVVRGATVAKDGQVTWPPPPPKLSAAPAAQPAAVKAPPPPKAKLPRWVGPVLAICVGGLILAGIGAGAPPAFLVHFTVFVLAVFVGYMVVWNVTPSLHTPLMSVTNAISSIIILGAMLQISAEMPAIKWVAAAAALITSINIFGGFDVTRRMLAMFRK
jgi:NAD(P) transhydrogenase subunit alpha